MILKADNIFKSYSKKNVVTDVSVTVGQGEIVGLLGPNGAGKTTTFYIIVGLIKANSGSVFLDNKDITNFPMYKRAQLGLGYLAQEASVFRSLSVEDNIKAVLEISGWWPRKGIIFPVICFKSQYFNYQCFISSVAKIF